MSISLFLGGALSLLAVQALPQLGVSPAECARFAAEVVRPTTLAAREAALAMMTPGRCGVEAIGALDAAWRAAARTERGLTEATARYADRRLLEIVTSVALDGNRARKVRLEALSVLVRYADPTVAVMLRDADLPNARVVNAMPLRQERGAVPLDADDRASIIHRIAPLTTLGGDPALNGAVRSMIRQLRERAGARPRGDSLAHVWTARTMWEEHISGPGEQARRDATPTCARLPGECVARVVVTDTVSGTPLGQATVSFHPFVVDTTAPMWGGWPARTRSRDGTATVERPARLLRFLVTCSREGSQPRDPQIELFRDTITVRLRDTVTRQVRVDGSSCGYRHPQIVTSTFEGYYMTGFEARAMRIPGVASEVYASFTEAAGRQFGEAATRLFERGPRPGQSANPCWFIRGRGTLSITGVERTHSLVFDRVDTVRLVDWEACWGRSTGSPSR